MSGPRQRLAGALCEALNRVVRLDPEAARGLRRLEGRALGVRLRGPGLSLILGVDEQRFVVEEDDEQASAWIEATPGVLLGMAARGGAPAAGEISIRGDGETAHRFQRFFQGLRPDWEEGLTRVFGDVLGVQLARLLSGSLEFARRSGEHLAQDLSVYLREESAVLVGRTELDDFLDAVDDLRDDVDRLEARIQRLSRSA